MMPVVAGSERTRWLIVLFTATHVALSLLPVVIGAAGTAFALTAVVAGAALTIEAVRLARIEDEARARQRAWTFYRWSIAYVVMVTVVLVADRWLWPAVVGTAG
jgi:protoheme IX farnesyltransferase